jgi:signal peptidase I
MSDDIVPDRPTAVKIGIVTAIVLGILFLLAIPFSPLNVIPVLVFLAIALGLWRGSAWSGYGGALFIVARWVGELLALQRFSAPSVPWASWALATVLVGCVAYLLFRAGRALSGNGRSGAWLGWIALAVAAFLAPQVVRAYVIPTGAMEDTLLIGDQLLVRVGGASTPSRGDVIVFRYPVDMRQTFVKRCMGVPGDRIKLVNKQLYLNGKKLDEPYAYHKTQYTDSYRDNFPSEPNVHLYGLGQDMLERHVVNGEVVVPPDSYFAIGDNRDASLDSRYWGFVPRANLIGTPWFIYWSHDAPTEALSSAAPSVDQIADRYRGFFTKTRWRRIFMPVRGYAVN